jgi:hypothetical protein
MTTFWRNWLTVWCWAVAAFGALLAAGALEATSAPISLVFGLLRGPAPLDLDAQARFSLGILGAVTLGWSVTLMAAIQAAMLLGERGRPVWVLVASSVLVWFAVDTPLSIATGYGLNALPNTVFLATFLLPLLRTGVLAGPGSAEAAR